MTQITQTDTIRDQVLKAVQNVRITDIHTHLYPQAFEALLLRGIDELLTYHYLIAETVRWGRISPDDFYALSKRDQADVVWQTLFIDHSPFSESCRGVLTVLECFGLDVASRDLDAYRSFFDSMSVEEHVDKVFELAGVSSVVMTNDPFDDLERPVWLNGTDPDPRFAAALRVDPLLNSWPSVIPAMKGWGYDVEETLNDHTCAEVKRFLREWIDRIDALYMAVSLPPDFVYPEDSVRGKLIADCLLPVAEEKNIPFALMIGVRRAVNPALKLAADSLGKADIESVERLCVSYPSNKFLVTMLSRENQHELCIAARKFPNLMIFGCWWFLNNPSLIEEITRMRFDLLGPSVIPQHSDARVLDQIIYKWAHSREIIGEALAEKYVNLTRTGWQVTEEEIQRDVSDLFGGNFQSFLKR